jgi:succinoglycan biosynthesis protein ExoA
MQPSRRLEGDIISRIDGHCHASDFVSQNVRLLAEHPEAWVVGGPIIHRGTGPFGKATAVAMSHPIGVGTATHRFPGFEGYVDTVQFPTFRRWVFERIGLFDPKLVRIEDDELNYPVVHAGGKMFVSPVASTATSSMSSRASTFRRMNGTAPRRQRARTIPHWLCLNAD